MKIMASSPITSWQIDGETMETVRGFIFLGPKITVDGDCSLEIKRHFFLGRKAITNLGSLLKSRDITLLTKVYLVKAMVCPVVMYGCESTTIKKAKRQWIDSFKPLGWRRLLRVPWTAWRSNQSILKEINPEYSLEWLMLKLKLQYFGHLMRRTDSLEKIVMLGKIECRRRRGRQKRRCLDGIVDSMDVNLSKLRELVMDRKPGVLQSMGSQRVEHDWDWTDYIIVACVLSCFSCVQLFVTLWTEVHQAPLSKGFSRQEYWRGCHALLRALLLTHGSNPHLVCLLHWQVSSLPLGPLGKPLLLSHFSRVPLCVTP